MFELASGLFSTRGFMPHGHCFLWNPTLVWLHVTSDLLIALAYTSIPFTLLHFYRRRRDIPFNGIFVWFGLFIIACGATHVMEIWTLWTPSYWLSGVIKVVTAAASVMTAALLVKLLPTALKLPTHQALAAANEDLRKAHEALERRVEERTAELTRKNVELASEIAERRRAEADFRASEMRYRRLTDSGIIGVLTADVDGKVVDANDALASMLGYDRAELLTLSGGWAALTPPEWRDADQCAIEQLQRSGVVPAWEKELVHRDGRSVPTLVGTAMLEGSAGECISFVLDLTERKRAEAAVKRLREEHAADARFGALLDTAPDAMVVAGADGRINFVNVRTESLFGYTRSELLGQHLEILIPERARAGHAAHLVRFFTNPGVRPMGSGIELYGRRKDGTELPIEVSLSPLRSDGGITVSAAIRDISERKRMEAAAKLVSDRLVSAVESIQDAFALFDDQNRLVLCNSVYRRLIGDSRSGSLVGLTYESLLDAWIHEIEFESDADRSRFREARLRQQKLEATTSTDLRLRDGRSLRVIDRRTAEGGTVKTIWDLTEDMRLAEELREARIAAEAASSAKSEFLSSMSHELRTPLNAILGFAQLLQRDRKVPLSDRHRERVAQILKGGEHLLRLIDDILDLARIESGKVGVSIEPLSVAEVLDELEKTLEPLAAQRGIRLQVSSRPAASVKVIADRTRFAQILMNFGSNAIKYNRPAGDVIFSVLEPSPGVVRVSVRDTGVGIPLEHQAKLFQPFQRAGQETGPIEGTGIGLFITKRLAELMHGDVGFRSVPGEGSEFWVDVRSDDSLPQQSEAERPALMQASRRSRETRSVILYVEDNPANMAFMRDLMSGFEDIELLTAPTAEIGVELASARAPDVVIMDINLPGMSGLDALRALRRSVETQDIPVIALTAAASERDQQRGKELGFYRYLTKPVKVDELLAALEELLARV
jgi:PAS domain S-box-containing protein